MPGTLDFACRVSSLFPVMVAFHSGREAASLPPALGGAMDRGRKALAAL